jgi:hypothetical protein
MVVQPRDQSPGLKIPKTVLNRHTLTSEAYSKEMIASAIGRGIKRRVAYSSLPREGADPHLRLLQIDAIHTAVILRAPCVLPHLECGSGEGVVRLNGDLAKFDPFRSVHQIPLKHPHTVFTTGCLDRTVAVNT